MKPVLSSFQLYHLVNELQILINSKVDQIHQPSHDEVVLAIHVPASGKQMLRIIKGKLAYLATKKPVNPPTPYAFCAGLRKELSQARISKISQEGFERVLKLVFEGKQARVLWVELFGKGVTVLCDEFGKIIHSMSWLVMKERIIKPGMQYRPPASGINPFTASEVEFIQAVQNVEEQIVKHLATRIGLGGQLAEELCYRAEVDKISPTITKTQAKKLWQAWNTVKKETPNASIILQEGKPVGIASIPYKQPFETKPCPSLNAAFDEIVSNQLILDKHELAKRKREIEVTRLQEVLNKQREQLVMLEDEIKENQQKGEFLYENYQAVQQAMETLQQLKKEGGWELLKEKIKEGDKKGIVKQVNPKNGMVLLKL